MTPRSGQALAGGAPGDIVIGPLGPEQADAAFELATRVFAAGSTLHTALGIGLAEYRDYLRPQFGSMLAEGLSVAATTEPGGALAGCLLATDLAGTMHPGAVSAKFAPLAALTEALCRQYRQFRDFGAGEVVLIDMAAISEGYACRGVYQALRQAAQERAREKGYAWVVGELSSVATQHVALNRLGHQKRAEIRFAEFEHGGARPFAAITEPLSIILAEGALAPGRD